MDCSNLSRFLAILAAVAFWSTACVDGKVLHAKETTFSFELAQGAVTSAGIFDAQGRLVRVLWTMKPLPSGKQSAAWDGSDDFGQPAEKGEHFWRVVVQGATYANVGAIGNSGPSPTPAAHTPTSMLSVAVDAAGAVYTANGWDEAGADFKKWDAQGNPVYEANYQIRNGNPNGAPYSIAVDDATLYCGMGGWAGAPWNSKQQLQRFNLADGKHQKFTKVEDPAGHIQVYEFPEKQLPADAPAADAELMKAPLRAVAVFGDTLYAADALQGKIRRYQKATGEAQVAFDVKLPNALAIDKSGQIWVGHEHKCVSVFSADGKKLAAVLDNLGDVAAIALGPDGRLYVADSVAGQVKIYALADHKAKLVKTFGEKARAGDRAADHFFALRGVAVDGTGCMVTIQNEPVGGARLARWSPDGQLLWEQFGCEFVSLGNYGVDDPDTLYSMQFHRYRLADRAKGKWEYTGCMLGAKPTHRADPHGVPRLLKIGDGKFFFLPTGDGVQVYRVEKDGMRLASILGAGDPSVEGGRGPAAQWTWSDAAGDGKVDPAEVTWFKKPGAARHAVFGVDVDQQGNAWFAEQNTRGIWTVPLASRDARGNPVYDWSKAKEIVAKDESSFGFEPNMVQKADDGSLYAFGWSKPWPQPKHNPFWMGGSTLARFDGNGKRLWAVKLPATCVGLDSIPGGQGGCLAGSGEKAAIHHYTADGLLVGAAVPGEAMARQSGWFDNHASVAVNRDQRDGVLDIFAEDDYTLRIGWYRLDDKNIQVLSGKLAP